MPYNAKTNWRTNDIVTPDDLNRIEKGIAESASPARDAEFYVSPSGSDDTGTGEFDKPFRTIQKAIDSFPTSNNLSAEYSIMMADGSYPGFTLRCFKDIHLCSYGQIEITGNISIHSGRIHLNYDLNANFTLTGGRILMYGGEFISDVALGITYQNGTSNSNAIDCSSGAKFTSSSDVVVANYNTAVKCSYSHIHLKRLLTDVITTGIVCECGVVQIGDDVIQATTKFVTHNGGRIYVGAQTNIPNY